MMRSMYASVSGLRNHQTRMDVIGNNIANVNTAGFKKSRVVFKDMLYQNVRGASNPTGSRGGTNPMGVGLGMALSSIDQIHTGAPATSTSKLTDMAIDGNGYFVVNDGNNRYYTRAGAFDFDIQGNLTNADGLRVQGWLANRDTWELNTSGDPTNISIGDYKSIEARATTEVKFSQNLDSGVEIAQIEDITKEDYDNYPDPKDIVPGSRDVYDSLGNKVTVHYRLFKYQIQAATPTTPAVTRWACDFSTDPLFENQEDYDANSFKAVNLTTGDETGDGDKVIRIYNIEFDELGNITDPDNAKFTYTIDRQVPDPGHGSADIECTINFAELTQRAGKSTAWISHQNGYAQGSLTSYSVGSDGTITGVYDNEERRDLARVAIANFENPSGLQQMGGTLFAVSGNSGDADIGAPMTGGRGKIIPSSLEMSNVDLSEEFTDMIVTQRGFQANSRIITTSDEMLQELVNLKR